MNATPQNDLRHLFDGTHCLSKRQLRDYAASSMSREEAYAVESHLNTCPLCSAAVDGMLAHFPESADMLATVDAGFLKDHFKKHSPQIHLNTVAPAATAPVTRRIPGAGGARTSGARVIDFTALRRLGIAAAVVLLIGSLWWFQTRDRDDVLTNGSAPIAQAETAKTSPRGDGLEPERRPVRAATPVVADAEERASGIESSADVATGKKKDASPTLSARNEDDALVRAEPEAARVAVVPAKPATTAAAPKSFQKFEVQDPALKTAPAAESGRAIGEVNVRSRRYERPLIEPKQPGSRTVLTDKEVKMPTRSPLDAATTSPGVYQGRSGSGLNIGGGRGENTLYVVDGVVQTRDAKNINGDGKKLYKKGEYAAALKVFKQQMVSASGAAREEATLYAAKCHRALGQNAAAEKLLKNLADGKGSSARAARREMRQMDDAEVAEPSSRRASRKAKPEGQ